MTEQYQPGRLGTYTFESYRHGRKVYKKDGCVDVARTHYLYFYDWGPNSGSNWMIGLNPTTNSRGVESLNLEEQRPVGDEEPAAAVGSERDKYLNICVTDSLRMGPFRVSKQDVCYAIKLISESLLFWSRECMWKGNIRAKIGASLIKAFD